MERQRKILSEFKTLYWRQVQEQRATYSGRRQQIVLLEHTAERTEWNLGDQGLKSTAGQKGKITDAGSKMVRTYVIVLKHVFDAFALYV